MIWILRIILLQSWYTQKHSFERQQQPCTRMPSMTGLLHQEESQNDHMAIGECDWADDELHLPCAEENYCRVEKMPFAQDNYSPRPINRPNRRTRRESYYMMAGILGAIVVTAGGFIYWKKRGKSDLL